MTDQNTANENPKSDQLESNDYLLLVLSFIFPGVGQLMMGQTVKGLIMLCFVWGIGVAQLLSGLDALCVARARKTREIGPWEFFPEHKKYLGV